MAPKVNRKHLGAAPLSGREVAGDNTARWPCSEVPTPLGVNTAPLPGGCCVGSGPGPGVWVHTPLALKGLTVAAGMLVEGKVKPCLVDVFGFHIRICEMIATASLVNNCSLSELKVFLLR